MILIEIKAATLDKAKRLAELAAAGGMAPACHPKFPTRVTVTGEPLRLLGLVYSARSESLLTADAAFEAVADLTLHLAQAPAR